MIMYVRINSPMMKTQEYLNKCWRADVVEVSEGGTGCEEVMIVEGLGAID
jgi:hypothetical protein